MFSSDFYFIHGVTKYIFSLFEKNMYSEDVYFDDPDTGYKKNRTLQLSWSFNYKCYRSLLLSRVLVKQHNIGITTGSAEKAELLFT